MRNLTLLLCCTLTFVGCGRDAGQSSSDWLGLPVCKIMFGQDSNDFILIRRSDSELLIHRDGDPKSKPEVYSMPKWRLDADTQIAPFKFGGVEFRMVGCNEFIDSAPSERHALMLFFDISDSKTSFAQYCEVELKSDISEASIANFDGPLMVSIETMNYVPKKVEIPVDGGSVDFRVLVGTVDKALGCWTVVSTEDGESCRFPETERPVLSIDFPTANGTTVKGYFSLDEFC